MLKCWRAHIEPISSLEYVESSKVIISCSSDCTIRVWTPDGKFIGTFGQSEVWNLYDPLVYQNPLAPYDVLIDEQSMPHHDVISKKETFKEIYDDIFADEKKEKENQKEKEKEVNYLKIIILLLNNFFKVEKKTQIIIVREKKNK